MKMNQYQQTSTHRGQPTLQPFWKGVSGPEGTLEGPSCDKCLCQVIRRGLMRSPCKRKCRQEWGLHVAWRSATAWHPSPLSLLLFFLPLRSYREGPAAPQLLGARSMTW